MLYTTTMCVVMIGIQLCKAAQEGTPEGMFGTGDTAGADYYDTSAPPPDMPGYSAQPAKVPFGETPGIPIASAPDLPHQREGCSSNETGEDELHMQNPMGSMALPPPPGAQPGMGPGIYYGEEEKRPEPEENHTKTLYEIAYPNKKHISEGPNANYFKTDFLLNKKGGTHGWLNSENISLGEWTKRRGESRFWTLGLASPHKRHYFIGNGPNPSYEPTLVRKIEYAGAEQGSVLLREIKRICLGEKTGDKKFNMIIESTINNEAEKQVIQLSEDDISSVAKLLLYMISFEYTDRHGKDRREPKDVAWARRIKCPQIVGELFGITREVVEDAKKDCKRWAEAEAAKPQFPMFKDLKRGSKKFRIGYTSPLNPGAGYYDGERISVLETTSKTYYVATVIQHVGGSIYQVRFNEGQDQKVDNQTRYISFHDTRKVGEAENFKQFYVGEKVLVEMSRRVIYDSVSRAYVPLVRYGAATIEKKPESMYGKFTVVDRGGLRVEVGVKGLRHNDAIGK